MSLLGTAAMVAWHDLQPGVESEHDEWHSREHLFERLGLPGFRRGRRCRAISAQEEYFLMYEVDDLSVLTSPAYLARLNDPTPWSRRIIPNIVHMTRTLCRVRASAGSGVGTTVLTFRFAAHGSHRAGLVRWIADRLVTEVHRRPGVTGVHLLEGDDSASGITTDEMQLRGGRDRVADLVLVVEGYEADPLKSLLEDAGLIASLIEHGAEADPCSGLYAAGHIVSEADLS